MPRAKALPPATAITLALCLAGCGAASPPAPPLSAEQQAVARANALCAEYLAFARAWQARAGAHPGRAAIARLALIKRSAARRRQAALTAVARRPLVQAYLRELAARERALHEVRRLAGGTPGSLASVPRDAIDRLYATAHSTYAGASALGLVGCVGTLPPTAPAR